MVQAAKSVNRWNWSHNIEFTAKTVEKPATADELADIIKSSRRGQIKVVGTAHSFSDIADTEGVHISTENFNKITVEQGEKVRFGAGITYTKLIEALVEHKLALPNLPSLPHLNVVGSVVTGTHGGGI